MKKNGFTLAEVLITLAIIGVVATLTLPALMTNTQEQQSITAFKKGINTLTEAAQLNQAINGFDYASLKTTTDGESDQSLYSLLANNTQIDLKKSGTNEMGLNGAKVADNYTVFFRDGSFLSWPISATSESVAPASGVAANELQADGLVYGIPALFDTNGEKAPNILSNCQGVSSGKESEFAENHANCTSKSSRVIKDQFGVRLRNGYAVPNGAAANWAFNK